tara:strand:+ start:896 stop:1903 length:1008 start_codon:yes stop_codon:yes gene_type:complete
MLGGKIGVRDSRIVPQEEQQEKGLDSSAAAANSGVDGASNEQDVPELKKYSFGEIYYEGVYGSGMRIGVDRMNEETHPSGKQYKFGGGYGGKGATGCSAVDIYAGLASHTVANANVPNVPVNPSAEKDAARLYLSQMSDIDELFGFPDGNIGNRKGKSAAVLKADNLRLEGRESVKIVSGVDIKNSKDQDIRTVPYINLIAGGNVREDRMHPIPKGNNLVAALDDIVDAINDLSAIVDNFLMFQHKFNTALMSHKHPSPTAMGIGTLATGNPTSFCGGETLISFDCASAGFDAVTSGLSVKKDLMLHNMRCEGVKMQRLKRFSSNWLNSRHVYTS